MVKVSQKLEVTVLEVDVARKRIALSLKGNPSNPIKRNNDQQKENKNKEPQDMASMLAQLKSKFNT